MRPVVVSPERIWYSNIANRSIMGQQKRRIWSAKGTGTIKSSQINAHVQAQRAAGASRIWKTSLGAFNVFINRQPQPSPHELRTIRKIPSSQTLTCHDNEWSYEKVTWPKVSHLTMEYYITNLRLHLSIEPWTRMSGWLWVHTNEERRYQVSQLVDVGQDLWYCPDRSGSNNFTSSDSEW